jgi:two-component system OmpR family sensor kinase
VERLGGSIALENISGPGRSGLRVTVRLPLTADLSRVSRAD